MTIRAAVCIAATWVGIAATPTVAADVQARFHYGEDTLLSSGQYEFEGGKTLNLTVGTRGLSNKLQAAGISHDFELFPDRHIDVPYRYDVSLPRLVRALST